MSNDTNTEANVELDLTRVPGKSKTRFQVLARLGGDALHFDTFDTANANSRQKFLRRMAGVAHERGVELDIGRYDQLLVNHAAGASRDAQHVRDEPQTVVDTAAVLEAAGIDVLGENDDQSIVVWVRATNKRYTVKSPARLADVEMFQVLGDRGAQVLWFGDAGEVPEGKITPQQLRSALALAASRAVRLANDRLIGQGIWWIDDELVVVNGAQAHIYDGENVQAIVQPRFGNKIIDFQAGKQWSNSIDRAVRAVTPVLARQALGQLRQLMCQWNWSHHTDPDVVAALVPATIIQAVFTWRPLVSTTGQSDCGKSTLLEDVLQPIFGDWTIIADRSTEAGLRQAMAHDSCPVILDEFDKYAQRAKVLELFRTASRGGHVLRGTKDQTGRSYGVRHIPWFAAIESGDMWGADRNRRIRLELNPPTNRGVLSLPGPAALRELGEQVAAIALWTAPAVVPLADRIKSTVVPGVHGRLVECFAVPAAMHAVLRRGRDVTADVAAVTLRAMLDGRPDLVDQGEPDHIRLLRDILATTVRVSITHTDRQESAERSIDQLLTPTRPYCVAGATELLAAKGICIYRPRRTDGQRLFLGHDTICRELLTGTRWADTRIDQMLLRLPGAERAQERCGGRARPYGVSLPWPSVLSVLGGQDTHQDNENPDTNTG